MTLPLETTPEGTAKPQITEPKFEEIALTRRLEDYFLTDVLLENVQLGQAMSILRSKLQETDSERALALHKLAVTTPSAAVGRRVTLFSQSIPYLSAVQNVATQAGCTVEVTENRITLKVQPGPYPQTASKRAMKDLLSGLYDDQGRPLSESPEALTGLGMLASQLGIRFDSQGNASLTAHQWNALRQMQAEQRRQARNALPAFALYILPTGTLTPFLDSDPVAVYNLLMQLHQQGYFPYSRLPESMDPTVAYQILMLMRRGEAVILTLIDIPATESVAEVDKEPAPTTTPQAQTPSGSGVSLSKTGVAGVINFRAPSGATYGGLTTVNDGSLEIGASNTTTSFAAVEGLLNTSGVSITRQVVIPTAPPGDSGVLAVPTAPPAATE